MNFSDAITICHACKHACPHPRNGPCACAVNGRDIIQNAKRGDCPKEKFTPEQMEAATSPAPIMPTPYEQWPQWAKWLGCLRTAGEGGAGDTAARMLGKSGELFKRVMKRLGAPCGCSERQQEWNSRYPYDGSNE